MKKFLNLVLLVTFFISIASPSFAASESLTVTGKRGVIVAKSAVYGLGGGLVVGLASQVFKKKSKNIFLFGSLGMYAGIALGIYMISTAKGPMPYEGPDTYDDFGLLERYPTMAQNSLTIGYRTEDISLVDVNLFSLSF